MRSERAHSGQRDPEGLRGLQHGEQLRVLPDHLAVGGGRQSKRTQDCQPSGGLREMLARDGRLSAGPTLDSATLRGSEASSMGSSCACRLTTSLSETAVSRSTNRSRMASGRSVTSRSLDARQKTASPSLAAPALFR